MNGLEEFVRQSNAIEGIFRTAYSDEIVAHEELLALPELTVLDVETFVWTVAAPTPSPPHLKRAALLGLAVWWTVAIRGCMP